MVQKIGGHELIARNRRENPKRIQVGQFYGPTVKNTFATIIFKKLFQKIGGHELIARNRREDTKRNQMDILWPNS